MKRVQSIDIVRGIVMIIMALDHTRDILHFTAITESPTNLQTTTPVLFLTRWITHFCAPTFVFLSGASAFLSFQRTKDIAATQKFLLTRGIWLIILEFTLVNFGVWFDPHFSVFLFDVIATIGFGFIILACYWSLQPKQSSSLACRSFSCIIYPSICLQVMVPWSIKLVPCWSCQEPFLLAKAVCLSWAIRLYHGLASCSQDLRQGVYLIIRLKEESQYLQRLDRRL